MSVYVNKETYICVCKQSSKHTKKNNLYQTEIS